MNRRDIIEQVKQPAMETMKNRKVLASVLIAESILISEQYENIIGNNPLRLRSEDDMIMSFDNIEDCYNTYINCIINSERKNIIGNYNYKSLSKEVTFNNRYSNAIIEIIEAYRLYDIDNEILSDIYNGKRTVVEIDGEPFIDCYKVSKDNGNEVLTTFNKNEAIKVCKEYYGYSVFNSKGNVVFSNELTPEIKTKMELEERLSVIPKNGSKVYLNSVNLYERPDSKSPLRSITGFYYVCGSRKYNNRYMITSKPEYINDENYALGYINDSDRR